MVKKYITAMLICLVAAMPRLLAAGADGWSKYPLYSEEITSVVAAKDKVYYVSCGNLFSFDETTQETYCYSSLNKLTGDVVREIYYSHADGFLLIVYDDANLDVLYDDGSLLNLPEIRDSSITSSKAINDVDFGEGIMLIGTDFGIVVYDLAKMEVRESGIFNLKVNAVLIEKDRLVIYAPGSDSYFLWYSPISGRHNNMSKFSPIGWGLLTDAAFSLSDTRYLFRNYLTGELYYRDTNADRTGWASGNVSLGVFSKLPLKPFKGGYYTIDDTDFVCIVDGEVRRTPLPEDLRGQRPAIYADAARIWLADREGIAKYDLSNPNSPEVLYDKAFPIGATTVSEVGFMRWSAGGDRLYVSNLPFSNYKSWSAVEGSDQYQTLNIIENGFPRDASLMEASAEHEHYSVKWQNLHGNKRMYGDPNSMVEDPDDPAKFYCSTNFEGVYVVRYNDQTGEYEEIGRFTDKNSPMPNVSGYRSQDLNIDPQGNLWVGYLGGDAGYCMLPAAKRRKNPDEIVMSDWKNVAKLSVDAVTGKDMKSLICRKSNMIFFFPGNYDGYITALDTKGSYDDLTDDVAYTWTRFTDQDGITFEPPTHITSAIEDDRGRVWIGTSRGIFEISNPSQATNPSMKVRRIKVPRNDGTDYADYLLDTDMIYWMSLDPAGRKWVATEGSGLFLVSETGDKILRNFTVDNSPLPSNLVTSVECDPHSNKVYVGTLKGLYSFLSDASPGMDDLSDILAYPNPVRPEYTGEVTITGLMDNSIVKIADAQGNVIYQTRSQGGMASWNPYTASGARVRTGVYFIYVTSSDGSRQVGKVSKVMVVN